LETDNRANLTKDWEELRRLVKERSFKFGDFTLTSGKKSSYYFDGKQVTLYARGAYLLGRLMAAKIAGENIQAVGGLTLGADPMAGSLAVSAYSAGMPDLKLFIVRKEVKGHGTGKRIEGPALSPEDRVVVVDDVITSGGSIIKAIEAVRSEVGCEVVKAIALVDRLEGGTENIEALGVKVDPIFTIKDFM
jgi:orotate phosphoribosyltransferase